MLYPVEKGGLKVIFISSGRQRGTSRDADLLDFTWKVKTQCFIKILKAHYHPKMRVILQYDETREYSLSFFAPFRRNVDKKEQICLCLVTDKHIPDVPAHHKHWHTHINKSLCCRNGCMRARNQEQYRTFYSYKSFIVRMHIFQVCHGNLFSLNQI